ncbi:restriction endonuclease subunit S [Microcoleus sp. MON2_D5]|uniref:restriction endonuclease subunit S n=1 Tax=Microcoleus sp. MON2_D5 TaxID=2818833 RepID=UPI002FD0486C
MDFKTFLENFDAIAEAPGGIPKLRSLILEMAVRGKLVPSNPEEREAKFDIDDIRNRVKELEKEGRIRKQQKALPLSEELPYRIPIKWNWVRFVDVASIESNLVKPDDFSHYPHIAPNHIEKDTGKLLQYQTVFADEVTSPKHRFFPGQLIYSKIRPNLNKVVLVDFEGLCSADMYPISTGLYPRYLLLYMLSQTFLIQVTSSDNRLAMPKVNQDQLSQILIAVPPLAEQKRIVEKVDELMALCDRYEAAKQTRDNLRQKLRGSAIASLMNAETDEELDDAWAFVRDNWHNLSQQPEDADGLRKTVLQLAVRGKLVSQCSEDESASELLNRLGIKPLNSSSEKLLFALPKTWQWLDTELIADVIDPHPSHRTPPEVRDGVPYIGMGDINKQLEINFNDARKVSKEVFKEHTERYALKLGDFIFGKIGTLGQPVKLTEPFNYTLSANVVLIQPHTKVVHSDYLYLYMTGPVMDKILSSSSRVTTHAAFGIKRMRKLPVPLPPLAEQKRIVAKVDELMKLCDQLEASLRESQQRAESLAASVISHLTI